MSAVQLAGPTLLGIEQPLQAASLAGRSLYQSRRARGRSTIASLGAAASPVLSDATGEGCQPRDASRLPTRAVRPPGKSSRPDLPRTAGHPWSGWEAAQSNLHG